MVAVGGLFIPATQIACSGVSSGVCIIAAGLTFLKRSPTRIRRSGPIQYAATRINLAQSRNGIGLPWTRRGRDVLYSKNAAARASGRILIPMRQSRIVIVLALFSLRQRPRGQNVDDYHI
jgi:hypothetical protein